MYTKLDACLTIPRPRELTRAAATGLDGLPDELIGDIPRPAPGPAPALRRQRWGEDTPRRPWAGVLWVACGGLLLLCLSGLLTG